MHSLYYYVQAILVLIPIIFLNCEIYCQDGNLILTSNTLNYKYSSRGRLEEVKINNSCASYSYEYDKVGNRTLNAITLKEQNSKGEPCACFNEILRVYEDLVSNEIFGATEHIVIESNVADGVSIDVQAGRSITLKPGTTINAVQKFHARIGPCDNIIQSIINQPSKE